MKEIVKQQALNTLNSFTRDTEHSMEVVAVINDVTYINDSKATNARLAAESINSIDAELILIIGGDDSKTDYSWFTFSNYYNIRTVIYYGRRIAEIKHVFRQHVMVIVVDSMENAVELSKSKAIANQAVLFTPACSSNEAFDNYKNRGNKFKELVLKNNEI
jgi:UDP-N-acetylmuramoylalanine--D-glutamate ligase